MSLSIKRISVMSYGLMGNDVEHVEVDVNQAASVGYFSLF